VSPFALALFLYYAYNGGASERAFASIAAAEPTNAMAYWGEALAAGPNLNVSMTPERFARAQAAIAKAVASEAGATPAQRELIDAMALRYRGTFADAASDDDAYRAAMQRMASDGGDATVRNLTAEALLEHRERAAAIALIDAQLATDANDVMANHLCIHAYDEAADREPAVPCARRLDAMSFPPEAEHLAHMPAHTWIETGDYAAALASSERAFALFAALLAQPGRDTDHDGMQEHDVYVGYSAAMMLGNYARATVWSDRLSSLSDLPLAAFTALRFGRFDEAYRLTEAPQFHDVAVRGYAALLAGHLEAARAARAALGNAGGEAAELFEARFAESEGNNGEADRALDRLAAYQRNTFASELIALWPALEARGGLALRRHDYAAAAKAFRDCLTAYPNDPRALFGLAAALDGLEDVAGAREARNRFNSAWAGADTTLTIEAL